MKRFAIAGIGAATMLGGCFGGPNADRSWAYLKSQEIHARGKEAGRLAEQMRREAIAKGAMDPLDRAEVEAYRAYMDAKYPLTKKDDEKGEATPPKQR